MALLLKCDGLFLHVPKTAGTWVTAVLRDLNLVQARVASKHADMEHVLRCARHYPGRYLEAVLKVGPFWQQKARRAFKFCFVRHPLSWYESYWLFMNARGWNRWGVNRRGLRRWHPNAALDGLGADDFNQFIRNVLETKPGYVGQMYGWYATAAIDFVGRQERLACDVVEALSRMRVPFEEDRVRGHIPVNVSRGSDQRPVWDKGLLRDILRAERAALETFGYTEEREER